MVKIDIHTHTRKCKSGDAPTREVTPEGFCEAILATDVGIVAITNHNVFDLAQYSEIVVRIGAKAQVWPGIEFDVMEDNVRAHLIVIVSPKRAETFSAAVEEFTRGSTADSFTTSIDLLLQVFDSFEPLYVAHYNQKKPNLSEDALQRLIGRTAHRAQVIKEVTNAISAGIHISHGHPSIYGSDVHDWARYEERARDLPDLRLPVDSFEHFCLLLRKDPTTINTALHKKTAEELWLQPFSDSSFVKFRAYNDINVVFGPKGTGKTCILQAVAEHYRKNGVSVKVFKSSNDLLEDIHDLKGNDLKVDLAEQGLDGCADEIEALRNASEVNVTPVRDYVAALNSRATSQNARKILLGQIVPESEAVPKDQLQEATEAAQKTHQYLEVLTENKTVKQELGDEDYQHVTRILSGLLERLRTRQWRKFSEWQEIRLLNSAIGKFRAEIARKTGQHAKPTTVGFHAYALNRIEVEANAIAVITCVGTKIPMIQKPIGSLGPSKGELELRTEIAFQDGFLTDSSFVSLSQANKKPQKDFIRCIATIKRQVYAEDLFLHTAKLRETEDWEEIKTTSDLLQFKRYFALNGTEYVPSSGESSMVLLRAELDQDKEVYILDEPERSLGNEYISEVIVPLIRDRARAGRKIFISTHDANIAVRTLPYNSLYRCYGGHGKYKTYVGNPFSNDLINTEEETDRLDWKKISMKTLEGGEEAFGERGKIYGNDKS